MAADKYDAVLLKAQQGKVLSRNEQYDFEKLTKEHGTERGNKARQLRDNKK